MNSHKVSEVALKRKVEIQHMVFMEKEGCSHSILQVFLLSFGQCLQNWKIEYRIYNLDCISYYDWKVILVSA